MSHLLNKVIKTFLFNGREEQNRGKTGKSQYVCVSQTNTVTVTSPKYQPCNTVKVAFCFREVDSRPVSLSMVVVVVPRWWLTDPLRCSVALPLWSLWQETAERQGPLASSFMVQFRSDRSLLPTAHRPEPVIGPRLTPRDTDEPRGAGGASVLCHLPWPHTPAPRQPGRPSVK